MKKLFSIIILSVLMFLGGYYVGQHMERMNLVKAGYGEFDNGEFQLKTPVEILGGWGTERLLKEINEVSETE